MLKLIIAAIAMTATSGAASAQKYYMRAVLPAEAFPVSSAPVDNHVYRWSQPADPATPFPNVCIAGFKTYRYITQCYDDTAGAVVADAKCTSPAPAPYSFVFACVLSCSSLVASKMPPQPGKYLGTATATNARALCNKEPAQNGICYRDTTTSRVTFGYSDPSTILDSPKSTDTAVYCAARETGLPLP